MDRAGLHQILKRYWGYDHFRPLQLECVESVCNGEDTLVLMPTGGGKSVVYQLPGLAMRGVCIVVTPLIALMKDQVDRLRSRGILAHAIHSGIQKRDIDRILDNCVYGDVKFLYISPERIDSDQFRYRFAKMNVSLIAVDEAHCISQWGYDFRPAYLKIATLRKLKPEATMLALTASATPEVAEEIMLALQFSAPNIKSVSFARDNLSYVVRATEDKREQLLRIIDKVPGSGIVYVRTRERAEVVAKFLKENNITADFYHGGLGYLMRSVKQDAWIQERVRVMVATNAFGMGIDKANVRFVVHHDLCDSLEAYYQEAGRAGRDNRAGYAVILFAQDDPARLARRIYSDYPPVEKIKEMYEALFNYLQIPIGAGKGSARMFNLHEFSAQYRFFPLTVTNAFKILQQNNYLTLTDEMDNPPKVHFIVQRDDLYRVRVNRPELDNFIALLLRRYTALFSDFAAIDLSELAHLSGYTLEKINDLLRQLWQLHIIKYIPGNRSPMLILNEERLPTENVRISPESHRMLKELAEKRVQEMLHYLGNETECRSTFIQHYFGQSKTTPCGVCDYCLSNRKRQNQGEYSPLREQILFLLQGEPTDPKTLVNKLKCDADRAVELIDGLLATHKIVQETGGKLRINR